MAAAIVASKELDRRGKLGMIKDIPTTQVVGAKPQWNDFIFPVFVGYFIGMKILGAIIHNPSLLTQGQNTVAYLFSGQGYHIYGAIVGLAAAVYTYYKINKEALPEPKIENTFIQPQDLIGELVMVAAIFGVVGASVFEIIQPNSDTPRGVPQIEVTFDIDANGIVNVSAQDKATGKVHNITIQASGGLDESEIERMVKEAEENADADKEKREAIDTRNQAESMIHGAEKSLVDLGDKADADAKNEVEQAITDLKTSLEGEDISAIKEKTSALSAIMMKMGEAAYKASEQNNSTDSEEKETSSNENNEDVVDADFEEVKDNEEKKDAS